MYRSRNDFLRVEEGRDSDDFGGGARANCE